MDLENKLYRILGLEANDRRGIKAFCESTGIIPKDLKYWNDHNQMPTGLSLKNILNTTGLTIVQLQLALGIVDRSLIDLLSENASKISSLLVSQASSHPSHLHEHKHEKVFSTNLGSLYEGDCISLLSSIDDDSVDLIFADYSL